MSATIPKPKHYAATKVNHLSATATATLCEISHHR
jgi:hypothetical protein